MLIYANWIKRFSLTFYDVTLCAKIVKMTKFLHVFLPFLGHFIVAEARTVMMLCVVIVDLRSLVVDYENLLCCLEVLQDHKTIK